MLCLSQVGYLKLTLWTNRIMVNTYPCHFISRHIWCGCSDQCHFWLRSDDQAYKSVTFDSGQMTRLTRVSLLTQVRWPGLQEYQGLLLLYCSIAWLIVKRDSGIYQYSAVVDTREPGWRLWHHCRVVGLWAGGTLFIFEMLLIDPFLPNLY